MVSEPVFANLLVGAVAVLSLVLFALATRAWAYARGPRTLLLSLAFGLYAAKSLVLLGGLFLLSDWRALLLTSVALDAVILLGFYLASLR